MASVVLSGIGSAVGNELLPGLGGRLFSRLASKVGTQLDQYLGLSSASEGSRITNLRVSDSKYGGGIPLTFGQVRVAGNTIWASDLIETKHSSSIFSAKGGLISSSTSGTTYTYSIHCAVAITEGEIGGILTIWGDTTVIYQNGVWTSGIVGGATIYKGTTDQEPDPLMQSYIGSASVPAYRGISYIVFEGLQLKKFGSRLPSLTFEILPANTTLQPQWMGSVNAKLMQIQNMTRDKGMPPLVIEGTDVKVRRVLVGGMTGSSDMAINVADYDVTGDVPVQQSRVVSSAFAMNQWSDASWAMAPDGRFIAIYVQNNGSSPTHRFVIYDSETATFGDFYTADFVNDELKQIYWIDAQHFIIGDINGTTRGVRVFARAGLGLVDLGFHDVWGSGTLATMSSLYYASFMPFSGGVLYMMADCLGYFTSLKIRPLYWQNNALVVGDAYTLVSGYTSTTGSGPMGQLIKTGDGEWTVVFCTTLDMQMMSFVPTATGFTTVRPWQTIKNSNITVSTCSYPVLYGDRLIFVQRSSTDNYYRLSEVLLNEANFSLDSDAVIVTGFTNPCANFGAILLDGTRLLLTGIAPPYYTMTQLAIVRRCLSGDTLDNVVGTLLQRAGYATSDYDVTALSGTSVDGYVLDDPMTAASAIEPLQVFAPFDLVESGAVLKAVPHANSATVLIDESERSASAEGKIVPSVEQTRLQELDLPVEITIDYMDASRDYETGTQRAKRQATKGAKSVAKITLPLVCTATDAKQVAEARLYSAWAERDQAKICLSRKYLTLDPGDVVDLGDRLMRVSDVSLVKGVVEASGVLVPSTAVTSSAVGDGGVVIAASASATIASQYFMMDVPLLRTDDDQPGCYAVVSGIDGWKGASLWRSADGVSYADVADFSTAAVAGLATSVLSDAVPFYMDKASTVNVQLLQGSLASCSAADLLNGANAALIGDELIQFQTATLVASGLYRLGNLLRGRRGTEAATSTHVLGERFVLLTSAVVQFLPCLLTDRGKSHVFRALSNGQSLGDVADSSFTYGLKTLKPLSPVHLGGSRASGVGTDLTLTWKRRARKNADWVDYIDVPLDETGELYDVEIMNGVSIVRTFSSVAATSQLYSAAQQAVDWGSSVPSTFVVNVYQISARYGRGAVATAVL